ncbi:MAG: hypothetical protein ACJ75H_07955, partial [Thermoanaerobaculia bacterium]
MVNVTVQAVEAPLAKLPERTVVGEQLHDSARLGFGTLELTFAQLHLAGVPGSTSFSGFAKLPGPSPQLLPLPSWTSLALFPQVAQVGMSTKPSTAPFVPSAHFKVIGSGKMMNESSHLPSALLSQVELVPTFAKSPQVS